MTKSVLPCTLFLAFSNTVVITMQADMGNMTLLAVNAMVSIGGAVLCLVLTSLDTNQSSFFIRK